MTPYEHHAIQVMGEKFSNNIDKKYSIEADLRDVYLDKCQTMRDNIEDKTSNYYFDCGSTPMFLRYWVFIFEILHDTIGDVIGDVISNGVDSLLVRNLKKGVKCGNMTEVWAVKTLLLSLSLNKNVLLKTIRYFEILETQFTYVPVFMSPTKTKQSRYGFVDYTQPVVSISSNTTRPRPLPSVQLPLPPPLLVQVVEYPKERYSLNVIKKY
jgi:hypothetical protein